jgi:hypothetical protein
MKKSTTVLTGLLSFLSSYAFAAGGALEPTTDQFIQAKVKSIQLQGRGLR